MADIHMTATTSSPIRSSPDERLHGLRQVLIWIVNPLGAVARKLFKSQLEQTGPVDTFARLTTSRHLVDLQVIASQMIVLAFLVTAGVVWLKFSHEGLMTSDRVVTIGGAVLATTLGVLNWAYQTGSKRIGGVDLFACEISAICRVCLVVDFARDCLLAARVSDVPRNADAVAVADGGELADAKPFEKFTSAEQYTPVYDKNLADLQALDVSVVTYVTEFYTYRKTMMDYLRLIAVTPVGPEKAKYTVGMIYMQFLMYEGARRAVEELVEFEPNRAESLVNILSCELILYGFLREVHRADDRTARLKLRQARYERDVPALIELIGKGSGEHWDRAKASVAILSSRFDELERTLDNLSMTPGRSVTD